MFRAGSGKPFVCFCYLLPDSLFPLIPSRGLFGILVACLIYILDSILYSLLLHSKYIPVVTLKSHIFKPIHRRLIVLQSIYPLIQYILCDHIIQGLLRYSSSSLYPSINIGVSSVLCQRLSKADACSMSIRLNNKSSSSRTQISQTPRPSCSKLESQLLSSKSGTHSGSRTRSHEPKPRPTTHMESPTPTPTPRKLRKHNKGSQRPDQREEVPALQPDNDDDGHASSDEELLDLLGVDKHDLEGPDLTKKGGILAITRADIAESKKGRRGGRTALIDNVAEIEASQAHRKTPRKRGAKKAHTVEKGFEVTESIAASAGRSAGTPNRKGKSSTKQPVLEASGLASTLAAHKSGRPTAKLDDSDLAHFDIDSSPYDLAILSRSLPHQQYQMPYTAESEAGESIGERRSEAWDSPGKVATETPNVNPLVLLYVTLC